MSHFGNHWSQEFPTAGHPGIQYNQIYWSIELDELLGMSSAYSCLDPFTWVFLEWVARRVKSAPHLVDKDIHLTVIEVEYVSRYPCLVVYSSEKDHRGCSIIPEDVAGEILREIKRLVSTTSVSDMVSQIYWEDTKRDRSTFDR